MQFDFNDVNLDAPFQSIASNSSGPTPPPNPQEYQFWMDTSAAAGPDGVAVLKILINGEWVPVFINGVQNPLLDQFDGRNLIINGEMRIDQRHEGGVIPMAHQGHGLDHWQMAYTRPPGEITVQRTHTDIASQPFSAGLTHAQTLSATSALTVNANDAVVIAQNIEGQDCSKLAYGTASAKPAAISFWVKSSVSGPHPFRAAINLTNGSPQFFMTSYEVPTADVWHWVSLVIPGNTNASAVIADGPQIGYQIVFGALWEKAFSSDPAYVPAWGTAPNIPIMFQPFNAFAQANGSLSVTGVKMEVGPFSTALEIPTVKASLAACQRYFEKTFLPGVAPADATLPADAAGSLHGGNRSSGFTWEPVTRWDFSVSKAVQPTVRLYGAYPAGTNGQWASEAGAVGGNAREINSGTEGVNIDNSDVFLPTTTGPLFIHATAEAELA